MENLGYIIDVRLVNNKKNEHQNQAIRCKKVFDNDLVAIRKSKVNPM